MAENEVGNNYIDSAITHLLNTIGVKEYIEHKRLISMIESKKVKEAIKEVAKYLGLPIEVNLSYVPEGYRPDGNNGFQSTHLVKTDWRGRGTGGITAQVSIPGNLPFYGTSGMINFPISVRLSQNCAANPATLISIMAHELSHIVLHSLWHKEKENEFYTDLTAMMLGFGDIMRTGRKVIKTESLTDYGFMSSSTTTSTQTTTYGYLSDDNFNFAHKRIEKILHAYKGTKVKILKEIEGVRRVIKKQKNDGRYFKKYLEYVGKNLKQKISQQDGQWISTFHHPDYIAEFELAIRRTEAELKQFISYVQSLTQYNESRFEGVKKYEAKLKVSMTDVNSKHDRVRGAVIILKKYVSATYRLRSFLRISFSSVN